jgi:hypothetical protein
MAELMGKQFCDQNSPIYIGTIYNMQLHILPPLTKFIKKLAVPGHALLWLSAIPSCISRAYSNATVCQNLKPIGEEVSKIV